MDWKILVVDDHSGMRAFMRMALASAEYHVVEATDGSEAQIWPLVNSHTLSSWIL